MWKGCAFWLPAIEYPLSVPHVMWAHDLSLASTSLLSQNHLSGQSTNLRDRADRQKSVCLLEEMRKYCLKNCNQYALQQALRLADCRCKNQLILANPLLIPEIRRWLQRCFCYFRSPSRLIRVSERDAFYLPIVQYLVVFLDWSIASNFGVGLLRSAETIGRILHNLHGIYLDVCILRQWSQHSRSSADA